MALPDDETTTEQPSIDFEALGLEPVSDEELFGFGLQAEAPEAPKAETPEIDYEALGLEPVGDKELFGFEMPKEVLEPRESFLRPVADPFLNIGAGINDVVKGFTDAFGADNAVSQNLAKNSEWYRSLLSAGAKQDQEEIGRIMQEAEGQGMLAEIGAGLKALSVAPVDLVSQGIGSLIPFIATAGVGKAVGLSKAGIAILQGVQGGAVGGGIVKGEIYSAVKEQLINSGVDEAKAEKAANEAQAYNGKNLDQILLGVGLGVAASTTGADSAIRSLISRKVGKQTAEQVSEQAIQEVLRTGFVRGAVKDGTVEFATEALQGGQERLAANVAVGREGFDVEPMRGVFGQATLEGALGGILGGGAGGISAKVEQLGMRESVALRDAAKAAQEAKQNNAPASAAAVEEQINQTLEETPEQRVARLQEEATAAAGIELEEEGGVEPTVPTTPPVAPTPEGAVAPVEPVVEPVVAEPQPVAEVMPERRDEEYVSSVEEGNTERAKQLVDEAFVAASIPETTDSVFERHKDYKMMGLTFEEIAQNPEALREQDQDDYNTVMYWVSQIQQGNTPTVVADDNGILWDGYHRLLASKIANAESLNVFKSTKEQTTDEATKAVVRDKDGNIIPLSQRFPQAAPAATPPAEVAPTPEAITPIPETPNLEPLRRVARAEQTEEDVSGLVGQGLVELYNGQPVITQAGLEALPEAERPRLNPEARKIQIDTGSNEVVAEAISKNLRIGVDQVGTGVRMPAGWTLVEDIYVPPKPMERITEFEITPEYDVEETANVFASIHGKRPRIDVDKIVADARAKRVGKPEPKAVRPLTPKNFLGISVREALRRASVLNYRSERNKGFADIAAILAESPIQALSDEEIISLGSRGSRGREARWNGGDIGMASTKGMDLETFIHEVGHTLTADQMDKYEPSRRTGKMANGKVYIDGIRAKIQDDTVPEPVRRMFSLYLSTLEQLGVMDAYSAKRGLAGTPHPDTSQRRAQKLQREGKLRGDLTWSDLYALANVHEFVAQTFSSKSFQDKLKTLKSPTNTNKTLWQDFISAIRQILGFPSDSMAAAVVEATVDIGILEPARRLSAFLDNQDNLQGFQDALELKNTIEADITKGIGGAKDDFRKKFNREPHQFAGQNAKGFSKLDIEAQIKKYQERVDRYRNQSRTAAERRQPSQPSPAPEVRESRREDVRLNPLGYDITTVVEDINAGRTDGPLRAVNNVIKQSQELRDRIQREAARRQEPRARGKAAILDRLSRERAAGRISEETAQALTDFVNRIREDAIGDTALSIRKGGVSNFNFGESLVSFFLNQDQPVTGARVGIHEFFHGLSRFLPDAEVEQMRQDYTKNLAEYLKKNPWFLAFVGRYSLTPEQFEEYKLFNPKEAETKLQPVKDRDGKIVKYQIKYDADNYRYIMLDEWIAEKMTDLVRSKQAVPDTFMGKIAKVIRDFLDLIKAKLGKDVYESFYQTITDPKQKLNLYRMSSVAEPFQIYQPTNFNYAEDVLDRIRYTRTERDPIITQAAMDLKEGKIDRDEYQRIVDLRMPLEKFENIPIPANDQDMLRGLGERKAGEKLKKDLVKSPESIAEGTIIESRLDIPAYENENVWVVSMHKPRPNLQKGAAGEVIAYTPTAVLRNVEFGVTEPAAINIAAGKPKSTIATMKGSYVPMTSQEAYDLANRGRSEGWVEIGMNPIRHSYFYDKDTQSPVVSAEEVVQVGGMVLAKNPVYGKRDDYRFMALGGEEAGRFPTFETTSPEAATLSTMAASMAKVDGASEAKPNPENKPTYKISEIASVWMDQGGDARQLQDMVVEYTNLTPANAKKVANAIAKQYGLQQGIAEAGAVIAEPAAEVEGAPRKTSVQRLIEQAVGVRRPIVKLEVNEKTALKDQIRLKAREARETRKARKEAARELAEAVTQYVKDNQIRGPVRARQTISLAKQALKLDVNNEKAVDRYIMYVERVVENANYDKDLSDAKALRKRAKQIAKNKNIGPEQKKVLEAIGNINPSFLDNPYEYNVLTERYLLGFLPVTSARYSIMPDAEARQYLESLEEQMKRNQAELDRAELERFFEARVDFAQQRGLSMEDAESLLNEDGDIAPTIQDYDLEKRKATEEMLLNLAQNAQKTLKTYDDTANTARQKELISFMQKVKLESITPDEKKRFIRFANNVLANGETFGVEQFEAIAKAQMASVEAAKDKRLSKKFAAWISPIAGETATEAAKGLAQYTQSEADTLKNIFGREAVGAFRKLLGLLELDRKQTLATKVKEQIANKVGQFYENLKKKYGEDAVNMEAKTYAAAAGYFIQAEGNKTQEESIAYRRRLWQENIEDLRQSERKSDRDEAELKQKALEALTGNSNAEILNSLKSLNPASYEQLMWWKDEMHPEHKEFLKEHNENFRNQADNYSENDYLSIHYKWKEYVETPSELDAQEYEDPISFRIRQSANSIKRKEHANLPVNPKTNTKANIDINFGYNQYSALTDQIDRAYTAPAWESVWAFTRVPEFETIVGGRANANFVKNILRNIKATRSKRAMLDDENQIIGGNVALARRLATQATLGGATQPIRQVPDQLFKLFSTSGRWDIIASNIANSVINYSGVVTNNPLLDKFPISRRGDARAGSQFAAEFNELARKVEASATNKKWAKYKELMNKMGEFWMTPLRASDAWIAKVSWLSYYEAYLNRNNIKMESFEREAELAETDQVRQEAAAQAEYMVDFYAGASDPTKMAALSKQSNNGWREFAKLVFLPLNSFALQQKSALISDARDLMLREGDRKAALAGIVGNVAGMVAFHGIRIYLIGGLIYPAGMAVLKGIFGIDMDEPDEEEQDKQVRDNWRKMKSSIYANIVAGGAGQFFEGLSIDAFNKTMYLWDAQINPDEILNKDGEVMSFGQYEKEMSPFYRYRSYASPEYTFGLVDVLTEQAQRSVTQTGQLLSDEEMSAYTPNEQAYAYFSTTVEWLYFFKMMDTDATRVARRLKQDMDRQVKEREAELARIRSGR
jgi:hypothetical protein